MWGEEKKRRKIKDLLFKHLIWVLTLWMGKNQKPGGEMEMVGGALELT